MMKVKQIERSQQYRAVRAAAAFGCVLASLLSSAASANEVYGTVSLQGRPAQNGTLVLRRNGDGQARGEIQVSLDPVGRYRVFLEPGLYDATLTGTNGPSQIVSSLPAPVRRDLNF